MAMFACASATAGRASWMRLFLLFCFCLTTLVVGDNGVKELTGQDGMENRHQARVRAEGSRGNATHVVRRGNATHVVHHKRAATISSFLASTRSLLNDTLRQSAIARTSPKANERPKQPRNDLSEAELAACEEKVRTRWNHVIHGQASGPPVVLVAYTTDFMMDWLLGLSAAHFQIPLVLVGAGLRWDGQLARSAGVLRALQMLERLTPGIAVIVLDGVDTIVANKLTELARKKIGQVATSDNHVVVGTECVLWPSCRRELFDVIPAHKHCKTHWPGCYPNSGTILASPTALRRAWPIIGELMIHSNVSKSYQSSPQDQSALQDLYLTQSRYGMNVEVDGPSTVFASLAKCGYALPKQRRLRCYDHKWKPTEHMSISDGGLAYRSSLVSEDVRAAQGIEEVQRPLIAHDNGDPEANVVKDAGLFDLLVPPSMAQLRYRMLALDTAAFGHCDAPMLGEVLATMGTNTTRRPW